MSWKRQQSCCLIAADHTCLFKEIRHWYMVNFMKYIFREGKRTIRTTTSCFILVLFLVSTGFHNHAIQIAPYEHDHYEAAGHHAGVLDSAEFCTAHAAHNGMDKTDRIVSRISVSSIILRIQYSNEPVSDFTTVCRISPRSPPAA